MLTRTDPSTTPPTAQQPWEVASDRHAIVVAVAAVAANVVVLADLDVPVVRPVAGLLLVLGLPTYLLLVMTDRTRPTRVDAVVFSLVGALGGLIVLGLLINEVLPVVGVGRPLDRVPVCLTADFAIAGLAVWRRRHWPDGSGPLPDALRNRRPLSARERLLAWTGPALTILAVAGATRLNNGVGGGVTLVMLCLTAAVFLLMIVWRWRLRSTVVLTTLYFVSLALLLTTSLRGWDVTGHDIQREFMVFQITRSAGVWDVATFQDAYNACLSINILPTMLANTTGVADVYVFKALYQVVFALCPVIVYLIARRFGSRLVALLSVLYFVAFPTYFTDMAFLCRQEIAFLFLGAALLVATDRRWSVRRRRVWFMLFAVGMVLSHYSTTYVLVALIAFAVLGRWTVRAGELVLARVRHRRAEAAVRRPAVLGSAVLGVTVLAVLGLMTFAWSGPLTGTGHQVEETASSLANAMFGGAASERSSDVSYSLFPAPTPPGSVLLHQYDESVMSESAADRAAGDYYPADVVDRFPITLAPPADLPLTWAGRALSDTGIDVSLANDIMRQGAARLLQVFVCVGFLVVLLRRARGLRVDRETYLLAVAAFLVVLTQVVLPSLSVDYGVLRAFQQSLFIVAPFLAVGSVHIFGWLGRVASTRIAIGTAIFFFVSLTGVVPQVLGGYPPQLHLNNAGDYYDLYFVHTPDTAAVAWLQSRVVAEGGGEIQTSVAKDRFDYALVSSGEIGVESAFPALIRPSSYVLLNETVLDRQQDSVTYQGTTLTYRYPLGFLDETKNLIYSSPGSAVYR